MIVLTEYEEKNKIILIIIPEFESIIYKLFNDLFIPKSVNFKFTLNNN